MKRFLNTVRSRASEFTEHSTEAGCACAVMMVQGQLAMISLAHWIVALQTGLISGALATFLVVVGKVSRPWVVSLIVGAATTVADFLVHSGEFVPVVIEALLTGLGAGLLALIITSTVRYVSRRVRRARS